MTTATQLRKAARAQEAADEVTFAEVREWAVSGRVFAALTADGGLLEARHRAVAGAAAADDLLDVGAPVRGDLHTAGLGSLDAVVSSGAEQVAASHGVGPRAVRRLRDAFAGRG